MLAPLDVKTVNVREVLARPFSASSIAEHEFLTAFVVSLRNYFEHQLNAMAGNEADMEQATTTLPDSHTAGWAR